MIEPFPCNAHTIHTREHNLFLSSAPQRRVIYPRSKMTRGHCSIIYVHITHTRVSLPVGVCVCVCVDMAAISILHENRVRTHIHAFSQSFCLGRRPRRIILWCVVAIVHVRYIIINMFDFPERIYDRHRLIQTYEYIICIVLYVITILRLLRVVLARVFSTLWSHFRHFHPVSGDIILYRQGYVGLRSVCYKWQ